MAVFHRRVLIGSHEAEASIEISDAAPWTIRASVPGLGDFSGEARDLFAALEAWRLWLEARDAVVLVQGAAADVYPSGMAREAGGRVAYRFCHGIAARREDLLDIFAETKPSRIASVAQQRENFEAWTRSLRP